MENSSAARSGYGSIVLGRMALHAANLCMAALCAAAALAIGLAALKAPLVIASAAAVAFAFVALMLATSTIPPTPYRRARPSARPKARVPRRIVQPPPLPETFQPAAFAATPANDVAPAVAAPPRPRRASSADPVRDVGPDLDGAYAILEAEWAELARLAGRRAPAGSVLAA